MNTLSDQDLFNIAKYNKLPLLGVYQKDMLPKKLKKGYYIINLEASYKGNGTHWTVLYYNPNVSLYFDSYGFGPPKEIEQAIGSYIYSQMDIQDIKSSSCGFYCISFIKEGVNTLNKYKEFLKSFINNDIDNELDLYKMLYD